MSQEFVYNVVNVNRVRVRVRVSHTHMYNSAFTLAVGRGSTCCIQYGTKKVCIYTNEN